MRPMAHVEVTLPLWQWMRLLAELPVIGRISAPESSLRCCISKARREKWDAAGSMEEKQTLVLTEAEWRLCQGLLDTNQVLCAG